MSTVILCKHCGAQISLLGVLWYDQSLSWRQYCKNEKEQAINQYHEPYDPIEDKEKEEDDD